VSYFSRVIVVEPSFFIFIHWLFVFVSAKAGSFCRSVWEGIGMSIKGEKSAFQAGERSLGEGDTSGSKQEKKEPQYFSGEGPPGGQS
jgi:hypothetical protein